MYQNNNKIRQNKKQRKNSNRQRTGTHRQTCLHIQKSHKTHKTHPIKKNKTRNNNMYSNDMQGEKLTKHYEIVPKMPHILSRFIHQLESSLFPLSGHYE